MPHWWHYSYIGGRLFLLGGVAAVIITFDVPIRRGVPGFALLAAAVFVVLSAGVGISVEFRARRIEGQQLVGVGSVLLGADMLMRSASRPTEPLDLLSMASGAFMILLLGLGFVVRPDRFGRASAGSSTTQ